jgi:transcription elongation GreA/GreB family factor
VVVFDGYGEVEFVIVSGDAALGAGERTVSAESPVGRALMGRSPGEEVMVRTGTGVHFLRVRGIA